MTRDDLLAYVRSQRWAVAATVSATGHPHASVVGIVATDAFEIVIDTVETNRKVADLRRDARIALAIGGDDNRTIQIEGLADEPRGADLARVRHVYAERYPDYCRSRAAVPGLLYFRIRPVWGRYSDFRVNPADVVALDFASGAIIRSTRQYLASE